MTARLPALFILLALLVAPFGRLGLAEAAALPVHGAPMAMAMAGHCEDMPAPQPGHPGKAAVDCMIACAAMTPANGLEILLVVEPKALLAPLPPVSFAGIHPEAEPPPPRIA